MYTTLLQLPLSFSWVTMFLYELIGEIAALFKEKNLSYYHKTSYPLLLEFPPNSAILCPISLQTNYFFCSASLYFWLANSRNYWTIGNRSNDSIYPDYRIFECRRSRSDSVWLERFRERQKRRGWASQYLIPRSPSLERKYCTMKGHLSTSTGLSVQNTCLQTIIT